MGVGLRVGVGLWLGLWLGLGLGWGLGLGSGLALGLGLGLAGTVSVRLLHRAHVEGDERALAAERERVRVVRVPPAAREARAAPVLLRERDRGELGSR